MSDPENGHRFTRRYTNILPSEEAALLFSDLNNPPRGRTIARTHPSRVRFHSERKSSETTDTVFTADENKISELTPATSKSEKQTPRFVCKVCLDTPTWQNKRSLI